MTEELVSRYAGQSRLALEAGWFEQRIERSAVDLAGKTVLDLAGGSGSWDVALLRAGAQRVLWLDACPHMLEASRRLHREYGIGVEHVRAAMETVPLAAQVVDVVVCHDAIYHASDEGRVCCEVARVLRSGGIFWMTTRTFGRLWRESRAWWKKPLLLLSPLLARSLRRKLLPTPFALIWALEHDLEEAGLRIVRRRRLGGALYEFLALKDATNGNRNQSRRDQAG